MLSKPYPHPEERPKGASRRTQDRYAALRPNSCDDVEPTAVATPERLRPRRSVLCQELLDPRFCRRQGRFGLPFRGEFAVRYELRQLLRNRPGMRLVVARQHHA